MFVSHHSLMRKQSGNVLKEQIRRSLCLSQPGNLKEESASGIFEASSPASLRKCLAGESSAQEVEVWEIAGVNFSGVWIIHFLLSGMVDSTVAGVSVFVDLAVTDTLKPSRPVETGTEAAEACEHIKVGDQRKSSPCHKNAKKAEKRDSALKKCKIFLICVGSENDRCYVLCCIEHKTSANRKGVLSCVLGRKEIE